MYGLLEDSGYALVEEDVEAKAGDDEEEDTGLPSVGLYNRG
jgi:hypothetical protein